MLARAEGDKDVALLTGCQLDIAEQDALFGGMGGIDGDGICQYRHGGLRVDGRVVAQVQHIGTVAVSMDYQFDGHLLRVEFRHDNIRVGIDGRTHDVKDAFLKGIEYLRVQAVTLYRLSERVEVVADALNALAVHGPCSVGEGDAIWGSCGNHGQGLDEQAHGVLCLSHRTSVADRGQHQALLAGEAVEDLRHHGLEVGVGGDAHAAAGLADGPAAGNGGLHMHGPVECPGGRPWIRGSLRF